MYQLYPLLDQKVLLIITHILVPFQLNNYNGAGCEEHLEASAGPESSGMQSIGHTRILWMAPGRHEKWCFFYHSACLMEQLFPLEIWMIGPTLLALQNAVETWLFPLALRSRYWWNSGVDFFNVLIMWYLGDYNLASFEWICIAWLSFYFYLCPIGWWT